MRDKHPVLLYGRERGELFSARAHEDVLTRYPDHRIGERNAARFRDGEWEPCVAVYVEQRFPDIVDGYRSRGVVVHTDADLIAGGANGTPEANAGHQAEAAQGAEAGQVTPIAAARRRRGGL